MNELKWKSIDTPEKEVGKAASDGLNCHFLQW